MSNADGPERPLSRNEKLEVLRERRRNKPTGALKDETVRTLSAERRSESTTAVAEVATDNATLDRAYTHSMPEEATVSEPDAIPEEASASGDEHAVGAAAVTKDRGVAAGSIRRVQPAQPMPNGPAEYYFSFLIPTPWFRARNDLQRTLRRNAAVMFIWEVEAEIEGLAGLKKPDAFAKAIETAGLSGGAGRNMPAGRRHGKGKFNTRISKNHDDVVNALVEANEALGVTRSTVGLLIMRNILVKYGYMTEDGQIADPYPELQFET